MDRLEQQLRDSFAKQVDAAPPVALADTVLRRGRRVHRLQVAASTTAVVAVAALALLVLPVRLPGPLAGPSPDGPPRVPLVVLQEGQGELLDWPGGVQRSRPVDELAVFVASVPSGVLLLTPGSNGERLALLPPDGDEPQTVVDGVGPGQVAVAVAQGGRRAALVSGAGLERQLQEVEIPSGRVLRSVPVAPPLAATDEPLQAVAYSGDAVLLTVGEGKNQRAALWEPGDDGVVGALEGFAAVEGGAAGRGAFAVSDDDRCRTEVVELSTGGRSWRLCREPFVDFSPDGRWVLARNALGDGLVVRDARDGEMQRTFDGRGPLRANGWESADTVLLTTVDDDRTVVVRCAVSSGRCADAASFPYLDRIPQPVSPP